MGSGMNLVFDVFFHMLNASLHIYMLHGGLV